MNRWARIGIVLGGYALAFVGSGMAVALYDRRFTPADNQAMGGMIAGGEMMYGIGVFLLIALVPTGLGLWLLRGNRKAWAALAGACLGYAIVGLAAVLTMFAAHGATNGVLTFVSLLSLAQMLGSPLWVGGFALFAVLAPARDLCLRLAVAAAIEVVVGVCGVVYFLAGSPRS